MTNEEKNPKKSPFDIYKLVNYMDKVNYIWWCLEGTLLFWVLNLPLFLSLFVLNLRLQTLPVLFIFALPVGPALQALMQALHQVEQSGRMVKPFFSFLKTGWKKALALWLPTMVVAGLVVANIMMMATVGVNGLIYVLNLFLLVLVLTVTINDYLLNTYFEGVSLKNGLITTLKLMVLKSGRCGMSFMIALGVIVLMSSFSVYLLFLGVGIAVILLLMNYKVVAEYVEVQNQKNQH